MSSSSSPSPCLILTHGLLDNNSAKTCHGILRGSDRFRAVGVIDYRFVGRDAGEVMDGRPAGVPVVATVAEYMARTDVERPTHCLVGVALAGGKLPEAFREQLLSAIDHGLHLVNGLHTFLADDPEFAGRAQARSVSITDVRRPKPRTELRFWTGDIFRVTAPIVAVLGTDCALGKRTTARWLMEGCRQQGLRAEMIYTGQTGWMQGSPYGFIFDSTVNDFISGELEGAILHCFQEARPDLIFIEGQSALRNPTGPAGSEFILSGNARGVILQHAPGRPHYEGTDIALAPIESELALISLYGARVLAIALNEEDLDEAAAQAAQAELHARTGLPVVRPLREGVDALVAAVRQWAGV